MADVKVEPSDVPPSKDKQHAADKPAFRMRSNRRPPTGGRGRIHALISAIAIGAFLVFLRRPVKSLPPTYALCTRGGKNIYTVDEAKPRAECIVVHEGLIADIGSLKEVRARWGDRHTTGPVSQAPLISPKDGLTIKIVSGTIVPGLADSHAHHLHMGWSRQLWLGSDKPSLKGTIDTVRNYVLSHPEILNDTSVLIEGMGWDHNAWENPVWPTAADLESDDVLRGRRISLLRKDAHALWVSPKILEELPELPKEIEGGEIVRDESGNPTGIFIDTAQVFIPKVEWTDQRKKQYFALAVQEAFSVGLTSVHDAMSSPDHILFYKKLAEDGQLPIRMYLMGYNESTHYWGDQIPRLIDHGIGGRLSVRSIKLFADGALGSWGSAMLEPYHDKPESSGFMRMPEKKLSHLIHKFLDDGWQVNVHSIGDRANRVVLDAFEKALAGRNIAELRPRIEHAQVVAPSDFKRFGELGVIASVQPIHATSDMGFAEARLGPERVKGLYAFRTLLNNNARLTLGTDYPVETINPLNTFYAAVTRLDVDGNSPHGPGGWFPEQALTRAEALKGITLDPAYASFAESKIGSLVPGKRADYVILSQDIMTISASDILRTRVLATVLDGQIVYGKV